MAGSGSSGPLWAVLEDDFECVLVNARHVKQVPGRKTDLKDAQWLCQLLEAGLLKASLVGSARISVYLTGSSGGVGTIAA